MKRGLRRIVATPRTLALASVRVIGLCMVGRCVVGGCLCRRSLELVGVGVGVDAAGGDDHVADVGLALDVAAVARGSAPVAAVSGGVGRRVGAAMGVAGGRVGVVVVVAALGHSEPAVLRRMRLLPTSAPSHHAHTCRAPAYLVLARRELDGREIDWCLVMPPRAATTEREIDE